VWVKGVATRFCRTYDTPLDFKIGSIGENEALPAFVTSYVRGNDCLQAIVGVVPASGSFGGYDLRPTGWQSIPTIYKKNCTGCGDDEEKVDCPGQPDGYCCISLSLVRSMCAALGAN